MTYENLLLDQTGPVLKITVNRPEVRNAQSRIMLEEFDDALMKAVDDESVRAIIVAGAGSRAGLLFGYGPRTVDHWDTQLAQTLRRLTAPLCQRPRLDLS